MACPYPEMHGTPYSLPYQAAILDWDRGAAGGWGPLPWLCCHINLPSADWKGGGITSDFPSPNLVDLLGYEPSLFDYLTIGGELFDP